MQYRYFNVHVFSGVFLGILTYIYSSAFGMQNSPPRSLGADIVGARQLSSDQIKTVESYGKHWATKLSQPDATAESVHEARVQLLRPLQASGISQDFRYTYSGVITPQLKSNFKSQSLHLSVNAMVVISQLGTDEALAAILPECNAVQQPSWQKRAAAAQACRRLLESNTIDPRRILSSASLINDAARSESNDVVLQHLFESIHAADRDALPSDDRRVVRSHLLEATIDAIGRIQNNNDSEPYHTIASIGHAIVMLRATFISTDVPNNEKTTIGKKLSPQLGSLLSAIESHWKIGHSDSATNKLYATIVGESETFLFIIDTQVRRNQNAPSTRLKEAWTKGSTETGKDMFSADLKQWLEILNKPPYS